MSKKHSHRKHAPAKTPPPGSNLTIFWMVTVVTAAACEVGSFIAQFLPRFSTVAPASAEILTDVLFFAALIVGIIALATTLAVYRQPDKAPPRAIAIFAVIVGLLPIFMMFFRAAG